MKLVNATLYAASRRQRDLLMSSGCLFHSVFVDAYLSDVRLNRFSEWIAHWVVKAIETDLVSVEAIVRSTDGENGYARIRFGDAPVALHADYFTPNLRRKTRERERERTQTQIAGARGEKDANQMVNERRKRLSSFTSSSIWSHFLRISVMWSCKREQEVISEWHMNCTVYWWKMCYKSHLHFLRDPVSFFSLSLGRLTVAFHSLPLLFTLFILFHVADADSVCTLSWLHVKEDAKEVNFNGLLLIHPKIELTGRDWLKRLTLFSFLSLFSLSLDSLNKSKHISSPIYNKEKERLKK